ncbi:MAG: non-homologous end-joining DNA ligase [Methanomassiliicoccales archaeon]|nr:non-homologous end-joining DNA ligase [Methanomassiliicoccales archaeon]
MRRPMLARPGRPEDLNRPGYLYEPKLDGTRAMCYKDSRLIFVNRRERDITERYPELDFIMDIKAGRCVLDGEIVVFDNKGNPDFRLLQKREQSSPSARKLLSARHPATYVAFDVLMRDGLELVSAPLIERRRQLQSMITEGKALRTIVSSTDGVKLWELAKRRGIEGVMAKRIDSVYEEGRRSPSWIKVKTTRTLDCIIVGYTSELRPLSSLALGLADAGSIIFVGKVGTGFTDAFMESLKERLDAIRVAEAPVVNPTDQLVTWTHPEMVCEVEYLEVTPQLHLRAPSFKRLRDDKLPEDCTIDQIRDGG